MKRLLGAGIVVVALATSLQPGQGIEYTVEPGDALWTIAVSHEVSVDDLASMNGLADPNLIVAGHTLTIPDRAAAGTTTAGLETATHTVNEGDSLWGIAARYAVPLGALARQNGVGDDALIFPGQIMVLPITAAAGATPAAEPPASSGPATHTVRDGDSLWSIAERYGVTVGDLAALNGIDREALLQIEQSVTLPGTAAPNLSDLPTSLLEDPARMALMPVFDRWAAEYAIPADLLKSLAWFESGWNNEKRSSADAIGIGQILPITADFVSEVLLSGATLDPAVPEENIQLSARYLRYLLDNAGSVRLAVASYYQGLTATRQHGVYRSSEFYVEGIIALRARFD